MIERDTKLNTDNVKVYWPSHNGVYNFSSIRNIAELKQFFRNHIVKCRECGLANECKYFKKSEGDTCTALITLAYNFIDATLYCFNLDNPYDVKIFIDAVIRFIDLNYYFQNWRGIYLDENLTHYFRGLHLNNHKVYSKEILEHIARFITDLNSLIGTARPKFIILVEGDSEEVALPILFRKNQFFIYEDYEIINLKGKDTIQRQSIKEILKNFKTQNIISFLILDNSTSTKSFIDEIVKKGLIEKEHIIIWKKDFEDSVLIKFSVPLLQKIVKVTLDINRIRRYKVKQKNIVKALKKYIHVNKLNIDVDSYKKAWAKSIANNIENCYGKIYKYKPKSELEKQIFNLKNKIRENNIKFYMPTKPLKKWKEEVYAAPMDRASRVIK